MELLELSVNISEQIDFFYCIQYGFTREMGFVGRDHAQQSEGLGKPWSCCNSLNVLEGTGHSYFAKPSVSSSSGGLYVAVLEGLNLSVQVKKVIPFRGQD